MSILRKVVADRKQTLVLVTHDQHAASFADRVVTMRDGLVVDDTKAEGVG
jgi:putative ABC transport system ATP-binding protein